MAQQLEVEPQCRKLDEILGKYYKSLSTELGERYYANGKDGLFAIWCDENGFEDESLADEIEDNDPAESSICEFDDDFPLHPEIDDADERLAAIFRVIKECYINQAPPVMNHLRCNEIECNITNKHINATKNLYQQQVPDIAQTVNNEKEVIHFLAARTINNEFPVLPMMVDSFTRDRLNAKLIDEEKQAPSANMWMMTSPSAKELKKNKSIDMTKLENAIKGYCNRISPLFMFTPLVAIDDSVQDIANYIAAVSQFITSMVENNTAPPPFQVDLSIAVKKLSTTSNMDMPLDTDSDDDDGDDDDDDGFNVGDDDEGKIEVGDVIGKLKNEKCAYVEKTVENINGLINQKRILSDHFDSFRKKGKIKNIQNRRFNIFVDRRDSKKDKMIFFDPPSVCNKVPKNAVPEWYFESIRKCIIPRKGFGDGSNENLNEEKEKDPSNSTITAQTACGGKLITFSFHVLQSDKIKCYMYWMGQTMRFYPQDIAQTFKFVFKDSEFKKFAQNKNKINSIMSKINIKDAQYEGFYKSLNKNTKFPLNKIDKI